MDPLANPRPPSAPPRPLRPARGLLRRIYTSNPFYVLSADLVFVGLRMSFDTSGTTFETWALMLALAGYTLLLATTACLLIRLGNVWDDMRTLLLLVVLMFLAISVTFDETLTSHPRLGLACDLAGLLFAVLVSEGVLRSIRLVAAGAVPGPVLPDPGPVLPLSRRAGAAAGRPVEPRAALGPVRVLAAGGARLPVAPARDPPRARRTSPRTAAPGGSRLYPWVLFGVLAVAVCGRAFYLCISLHFVERTSRVLRRAVAQHLRRLLPGAVPVRARRPAAGAGARRAEPRRDCGRRSSRRSGCWRWRWSGRRPTRSIEGFLLMFMGRLGGSPLFLSLLAAVAFYAFATGPPRAAGRWEGCRFAARPGRRRPVDPRPRRPGRRRSRSRSLALAVLQLWLAWRRPRLRRVAWPGPPASSPGSRSASGKTDSATLPGPAAFHLAPGGRAGDRRPLRRSPGPVPPPRRGRAAAWPALLAVPGDPWLCELAGVSPEVGAGLPDDPGRDRRGLRLPLRQPRLSRRGVPRAGGLARPSSASAVISTSGSSSPGSTGSPGGWPSSCWRR